MNIAPPAARMVLRCDLLPIARDVTVSPALTFPMRGDENARARRRHFPMAGHPRVVTLNDFTDVLTAFGEEAHDCGGDTRCELR